MNQGKYIKDMLKKFGMSDSKAISTPMGTNGNLDSDVSDNMVDQKLYNATPRVLPTFWKNDRLPTTALLHQPRIARVRYRLITKQQFRGVCGTTNIVLLQV